MLRLCRLEDLTTYVLLVFSPFVSNGELGSFSSQVILKFVKRGMCLDFQKSIDVLFSSARRAHAMFKMRNMVTLLMMFSVRNLFFELRSLATPSALFSDLFDV